jgi:hypothetical protein
MISQARIVYVKLLTLYIDQKENTKNNVDKIKMKTVTVKLQNQFY